MSTFICYTDVDQLSSQLLIACCNMASALDCVAMYLDHPRFLCQSAQDDEALLADNPFHVPAGPVEANLLMLPSSARGSRLPSTAGVTDASAPSTPGTASVRHTKSTGASAPSTAHAQAPPPTSQMPSTAGGSQSGAPPTARSQASASDSGGAAAASKVDYLRPQRLAREAAELERELDAQLRALQVGDAPYVLLNCAIHIRFFMCMCVHSCLARHVALQRSRSI